MSIEKEKEAIKHARRCQRNWDHSKTIPQAHIDHWIDLAIHSPSKQDESFFDLYVLTDREKIDFLCKDHSWGFTVKQDSDHVVRNPQMGANVLFCFNRKMNEKEIRNFDKFGNVRDAHAPSRWNNAYTSIGIASGIISFSANMMGYRTGYGKNFGYKETPKNSIDVWGEVLGIPEKENQLTYSLGVGFPDDNLKWNQSKNNNEYLTGGPIDWQQKQLEKDFEYHPYSETDRIIKVIKV